MRDIRVLASPGTPIEQAVAAGEQADQQLLDDLLLADDDLVDLAAEQLAGRCTRCTDFLGARLRRAERPLR